jgi:tetratricopeptide (TPR) repeat protein
MTVRDHCVDWVQSKQGQGFLRVGSYLHLVPTSPKFVSDRVRPAGVIVDEKDRRHTAALYFHTVWEKYAVTKITAQCSTAAEASKGSVLPVQHVAIYNRPMKVTIGTIALAWLLLILGSPPSPFAQAPVQQQQPEFVKQGQQLMREGKREEALALYRQTLQASPNSVPANIAAGSVLDLMGKGDEARKYFTKANDLADTPEEKASAIRAMAMSYAFEGDCKTTVEYEQHVFAFYGSVKNFFQQGEIANEAARVCIDSGDLDTAYKWYKLGHDTGLKEPDIKPARQDLWNFRWEHAQARIASRRGDKADAQQHVAAAKAILDKATIPEQAPFFPYLKGYVAFYAGDYKAALGQLQQANPNDPFIQCMMGETYEKLGDKDKALEYYRKASATASHNPASAYAVPFARKKLS